MFALDDGEKSSLQAIEMLRLGLIGKYGPSKAFLAYISMRKASLHFTGLSFEAILLFESFG
jgi:hypothetical protein